MTLVTRGATAANTAISAAAPRPAVTMYSRSSWLNLVESWFSKLTQQRLRRGVFCSVEELVASIKDYLTHHNTDPKLFVWSTTVDTILDRVRKCKVILGTRRVRGRAPRRASAALPDYVGALLVVEADFPFLK